MNGELAEEIFLRSPPGFKVNNKKVLRIKKSLYGKKQAAKVWNETLHHALIESGFIQTEADRCLYVAHKEAKVCYLLIHVDDMIVATNDSTFSEKCLKIIKKKFKVKDLGEAKHFLGIDIEKHEDGDYLISQPRYIEKIIEEANLEDAKESKIPLNPEYYKLDSEKLPSNEQYRKLIGMLFYVSIHSRPDISVSISILSQKVQNPTKIDLDEVKRVIKYLKGTKNFKLRLSNKSENSDLVAYSDADWAEDTRDRKSSRSTVEPSIAHRHSSQNISQQAKPVKKSDGFRNFS